MESAEHRETRQRGRARWGHWKSARCNNAVSFDQNIARVNIRGENTYPRKCFVEHFPGFTHISARSRKGKFTVHVKTIDKRVRRGLKAVADWCQRHRHDPVSEQQKALSAKLRGHYQYYGRPTNYRSIWQFFRNVRRIWHKWLSRGHRLTWERFEQILNQYPLLRPRIMHTWARAGSHA
jgi:hypothetical protein